MAETFVLYYLQEYSKVKLVPEVQHSIHEKDISLNIKDRLVKGGPFF